MPQFALKRPLLWVVCNTFAPRSGHKIDTIGSQTATETRFFENPWKSPIFGCKSLTSKELVLPFTLENSVKSMKNVRQGECGIRNADCGMRNVKEKFPAKTQRCKESKKNLFCCFDPRFPRSSAADSLSRLESRDKSSPSPCEGYRQKKGGRNRLFH